MRIISENTTRKVDSLGRVSIPKGLRDRFKIETNDEVEFYTVEDDQGNIYVALTNHAPNKARYATTIEVLKELGFTVPKSLLEAM